MSRSVNDVYESLHGKFLGDVIDRDYGPFKIDREMTERFSMRSGTSPLPVRLALGRFYTAEEWEHKREELLSKPMPGTSNLEIIKYSVKRFFGRY